jgi:predicted HAD superfamily phosphohydrolase
VTPSDEQQCSLQGIPTQETRGVEVPLGLAVPLEERQCTLQGTPTQHARGVEMSLRLVAPPEEQQCTLQIRPAQETQGVEAPPGSSSGRSPQVSAGVQPQVRS